MKENPFSEMFGLFEDDTTYPNIRNARVVRNNPLTIQLGELQVSRNDKLYVADHLTNLSAGDNIVVIQSADRQSYNVIARVRRV